MRPIIAICILVLVSLGATAFSGNAAEPLQVPITVTDATGENVTIESLEAIASGSGDVTEIIVALGFEDRLVGVDRTSTHPPGLMDRLPDLGFARRLTVEPVADVFPSVFFCTQVCGPDEVLDQIRLLGIPVVIIPDSESGGLEMPFQKIEMVAASLGVPERGAQVADRLRREIDWVQTALANVDSEPAVFHFYIRGEGLQVAVGDGTPGHAMIVGAGAYNAALDAGVSGYQPLSPEIILTAFPEFLLLTEGNLEATGGLDEVLSFQGLNATPAVRNGDVVVLDTQLLLGMSLRTGEALMVLAQAFHADLTWEPQVSYPYTTTDATGTEYTVEAALPVYTLNATLLEQVRGLGFHAELAPTPPADFLLIAYESDAGWQSIREGGTGTVIVLPDGADIATIAQALNVPGRGAAYLARFGQ